MLHDCPLWQKSHKDRSVSSTAVFHLLCIRYRLPKCKKLSTKGTSLVMLVRDNIILCTPPRLTIDKENMRMWLASLPQSRISIHVQLG